MNGLKRFLHNHIRQHGPITIADFMQYCLTHPEYGYYMRRDPFGKDGDFITAPEISQMFGEMIGACLADYWIGSGQPDRFILLECGPGRGTLMADILRATRGTLGFHTAAKITLLETSPTLKEKQKAILADYNPQWIEIFDDVPDDGPLYCTANEFLDALPVRQLIKSTNGWNERVIALNEKDELTFGEREADDILVQSINVPGSAPQGSIYELSPQRDGFVHTLCERIKAQSGVALLIDYGYVKPGYGGTFQAVKRHEYCDVLQEPGRADLTAHVDFRAIAEQAEVVGIHNTSAIAQGQFLKSLGIETRADILKKNASEDQKKAIESQIVRLTAPDQMGDLFKVIGLYDGADNKPAGF